ncbi:MAG TPA: hypothetical protein ENN25_05110 [Euryarchaeota archaeon]|nr:hypothetical protein [Euryarchaeota archaeon]
MSISMSLKELESEKALCKEDKRKIVKVCLSDTVRFEQYCDRNRFIDLAAAEAKLGQEKVAEIKKRNRVRSKGEIEAEKIKEKADLETLKPFTREEITNWVSLDRVPEKARKEIMDSGLVTDQINAWDARSFDEMYETCGKCKLSWDKGRGCIATLIPSESPLPGIADKFGLNFIAAIPSSAEKKVVFEAQRAKELLEEIDKLRDKLPEEGKMMVRRLSGAMDRLESLAKTCSENQVRFYFS